MKRVRSFLLILFMSIICFIPNIVFGESITGIENNLKYEIDTQEQKVTITGLEDESITDIIIPETINGYSVTTIGANAFSSCNSLTNIEIPNSVTDIGEGAFRNCQKLVSIKISNSVTTIWDYTFDGCINLPSIEIPNSVTTIGNWAFRNCWNLTSIEIPNSVTTIGYNAFCYCSGLTSIKIPNSVTTVERGAFSYCSSLINIEIPDSITTIEWGTFEYCDNLTSIEIPNSVTTIMYYAFENCSNLKRVKLPKEISEIADTAFNRCSDDLTLYVLKNSYAENYAKTHNLKYEIYDFEIYTKEISKCVISYEKNQEYMGNEIKPKVIIKDEEEVLEEGKDYKLEYKNNIKLGNATIIIIGIGNYQGEIIKNFEIIKKEDVPFIDVDKNSYYYFSVNYCYKRDIIKGTTETTFKPNDKLTRGQLVTILWRMEDSRKVDIQNKFADVKEDQYYYEAVVWASSNKIVNGYSTTGKFGPNDNITREQLAIILMNYAKYKKKDTTARIDINKFKDGKYIADYSRESLSWAVASKIMNGKENGTKLDAKGSASRAEAVTMIANYCNYIGR